MPERTRAKPPSSAGDTAKARAATADLVSEKQRLRQQLRAMIIKNEAARKAAPR
jgi:hypothetical protein